MHFFTSAVSLAIYSTSLAAPLEQRASDIQTITFFTGTLYDGPSATLTFDITPDYQCQNLPASVDNKALSFKLSEDRGRISCKLHDLPNCVPTYDVDTVFLYDDVPNLGQDPYVIGSRTSSVTCFNSMSTKTKRCGRGGYCPDEDTAIDVSKRCGRGGYCPEEEEGEDIAEEVNKRCGRGGYCPDEDTNTEVAKRCGRGGYCPEEDEQSQFE
ncbi:hypothetical protein K491DRAFT_722589 [Lophiostoma macrostomum CBS 122681]|uniref:Uncharacterized protein n=1 Tax=Lophiostoma macrostomum CBS 122681 TaxID=1314788 RepID=A0A6A6SLC9_9PLEO|nr:hypothetical protein K491DRAFT_722589 [Lophiostoma macrostomum CBS 122681]